jgi:response regulator RpfG family c-di-GMP phosphodiesterase
VSVDHAERFPLTAEVQEDCNQCDMLYDVGKIARMEDVAVIHN